RTTRPSWRAPTGSSTSAPAPDTTAVASSSRAHRRSSSPPARPSRASTSRPTSAPDRCRRGYGEASDLMCFHWSRSVAVDVQERRVDAHGGSLRLIYGTIPQVTSESAHAQHLRGLAWLRRVRDRMDREYEQPLDVEALARGAHMSAGHLSREFKLAYSESPYSYLMTRRIERAMALLRRGDQSVTEVCFAVG